MKALTILLSLAVALFAAVPAHAGAYADISGNVIDYAKIGGSENCPGTGVHSVQLTIQYSSFGQTWEVNMTFKGGLVCDALTIADAYDAGQRPVVQTRNGLYSNIYGTLVPVPYFVECLSGCEL